MIVVVDTNIVFSTLLNSESLIGELLMNVQDEITFVAPDFLLVEIEKYSEKIIQYSKLDISSLAIIKSAIWSVINFVEKENISDENWRNAYEILKDIDPKDTPFLALAFELKAKIWTGDKKLIKALPDSEMKKYFLTTKDLEKLLSH